MSRFDDRLEHDLGHIADRAAPSPTAWEAIRSRMAEPADHQEMEIVMLQPDPPKSRRPSTWILTAAASIVVVAVVGVSLALFLDDGPDTVRVTDATTAPTPTTSAASTTAPPAPAGDADDELLAVARQFLDARAAYDGATVRELFAAGASVRDDLLRDENGSFLAFDEIDFVGFSEMERATGVRFRDTRCDVSSPGRVRCTYTWENAWSVAIGDDKYVGNSFVLDVSEGRIDQLTHTFAVGTAGSDEGHISQTVTQWLLANHPEDLPTMVDPNGFARYSPEAIALWETHTAEFVAGVAASAPIAVATRFMEARQASDAAAVRALVADDASISGFDFIDTADDYPTLVEFERALGATLMDPVCSSSSPGRVRCTGAVESDWTRALGVGPYEVSFLLTVDDGQVRAITATFADEQAYLDEVYFVFRTWLLEAHPSDRTVLYDDMNNPIVSADTIALWDAYTDEFVASVSG